jgi:hypothetical protein
MVTSIWVTMVAFCCLLSSDTGLASDINFKFQWRGKTLFLDPNAAIGKDKATEGLLFKMPDVEPTQENTLPLIPDAAPTFPGSRQFLFLNEMKFRELISDSINSFDGKMVRCFVDDSTGLIHPEGVACRILEKKSLKSGEIMCIIEAYQRMRVDSFHRKATSSYLTAVVSDSPEPLTLEADQAEVVRSNEETSMLLYIALKTYLRLVTLRFKNIYTEDDEEYGGEKYLCISPAIYKNRPRGFGGTRVESVADQQERHTLFSYAVGNLIKSSSYLMQRLVEGDTQTRLRGLLKILNSANANVANYLRAGIGSNAEDVNRLISKSEDPSDEPEDILPPANYRELCLDMIQLYEDWQVEEDEVADEKKFDYELVDDDDGEMEAFQ